MEKNAILFLDDEIEMLNALRRSFRKSPHETFFASNPAEALKVLETKNISVLVTDQRMPEMMGSDFLRSIKITHPWVVRVILSGFTDVQTIVDSINHGEVFRFIAKPWSEQELRNTIDECIAHYTEVEETRRCMGVLLKEDSASIL